MLSSQEITEYRKKCKRLDQLSTEHDRCDTKYVSSRSREKPKLPPFEQIRYLAVLVGRWVEQPDEDESGKAQQRGEPVRQLAQDLQTTASVRLTYRTRCTLQNDTIKRQHKATHSLQSAHHEFFHLIDINLINMIQLIITF